MATGPLDKMRSEPSAPVSYGLPVGEEIIPLNERLGKRISLRATGEITCQNCGRKTKKSYSQGHCFPCSQKLASCDMCIVRPEICHFHEGTCREPEWGEKHCLIQHTVYLANSSGLKVGITRSHQQKTRWIDQGASQALPILHVDERLHSGQVETLLKKEVSDRTDWRRMLKGAPEPRDLFADRDRFVPLFAASGLPGRVIESPELFEPSFPVLEYPEKIKSLNLEKTPEVEGELRGIKGQYLILDTGVLNVRKHTSFVVGVSFGD